MCVCVCVCVCVHVCVQTYTYTAVKSIYKVDPRLNLTHPCHVVRSRPDSSVTTASMFSIPNSSTAYSNSRLQWSAAPLSPLPAHVSMCVYV
jgi:hypothetical protein